MIFDVAEYRMNKSKKCDWVIRYINKVFWSGLISQIPILEWDILPDRDSHFKWTVDYGNLGRKRSQNTSSIKGMLRIQTSNIISYVYLHLEVFDRNLTHCGKHTAGEAFDVYSIHGTTRTVFNYILYLLIADVVAINMF